MDDLGIANKEGGAAKAVLLEHCRGIFPDRALQWLDAAYVLSDEGPKYPPLLGTGGNDGRLEFTNNFMQRLLDLLDEGSGEALPSAKGLLDAALFDAPSRKLVKGAPIGQFLPSNAGGANADTGFGADSLINPWDFVLMLEGATVFASALVRRTEQDLGGAPSYPFTVRSVAVGYASAAEEDETSSRAEMWLPLWSRPAMAQETMALLAEGRVRVGPRAVENGVDFARAVAGLGADRGVVAFQRYGFQVRNGLAYFAVPIGRFTVKGEPRAALLDEVDGWLETFRRKASGQTAPASVKRALRRLEAAIVDLCTHGDRRRLEQVLTALGGCELALARSPSWTAESYIQPVPPLSPDWLRQIDDGSVEGRLAGTLALVYGDYGAIGGQGGFLPLRAQLEPVRTWRTHAGLRARWDFDASRNVVWASGHLVDAFNAVFHRRLVLAVRAGAPTYPDRAALAASLGDIADFIEERVDEQRLAALLWGCTLIDWSRLQPAHFPRRRVPGRTPSPGALYALLKLCFAGPAPRVGPHEASDPRVSRGHTADVPIILQAHRLAAAGQGARASNEAIRRLRASGLDVAVTQFQLEGAMACRTAAALLFPISATDREALSRMISRPDKAETGTEPSATSIQSGATE